MRVRLYLVVFCVGVSTLGAEIAAARLLAPFFGDSTIVWANTIATVLVALSIGYWVGGTVADRRPTIEALSRWVLVGAGMVALIPLVAQPFLSISVEAFDNIEVGAAAGSLFGVLALVAVPVLVLGAVAPWAIRLRVTSTDDAGKTAGRLYALSTLGSLFGTFAASLLLIPLIGTQRTFIFFALLLAVTAALSLPVALRARARRDRGDAGAAAGRDQGPRARGRPRSWSSARPSTSTRAWSSARTASADWSSTRARPSTPSTGPTPC